MFYNSDQEQIFCSARHIPKTFFCYAGVFIYALIFLSGCTGVRPQGMVETPSINILDKTNKAVVKSDHLSVVLSKEYRLSIGDSINVRFHHFPDLNTQVTVTPDGMISLPILNSIFAFGKTIDELTLEIVQAYRDIIANAPKPTDRTYLIGIRDILEIRFIYETNFNSVSTVRPDGRISLPLVGPVIAEGKTVESLTKELAKHYQSILTDPVIVIDIKSLASNTVETPSGIKILATPGMANVSLSVNSLAPQRIFITGEVEKPGVVSYTWPMSAMQAVISGGGATAGGEMRNVVVLRKAPGIKSAYIIRDLQADIEGAVTNDIMLEPSDIVVVPKTDIAKVQTALEEYLYKVIPALKNSSVSAMFIPYNQSGL